MRATGILSGGRLALPAVLTGSLAAVLVPVPAPAQAAPATQVPLVRGRSARAAVHPATYRVVAGDTVSGIAGRFGLATGDVLAWNGLRPATLIFPGQILRLRRPESHHTSAASIHTVRAGETATAIARKRGVTTAALLRANGLSWSSIIYPGQRLRIPGRATALRALPGSTGTVVVHTGDTLWGIATHHGIGLSALLAANGLAGSSIIYPGQRLRIPSGRVPGLSAAQASNAALIVRIGHRLRVPERGIVIALGTAMQESGLRNLDGGDRDSAGLFQQRPRYGWGTPAQVRNADYAIRTFFLGAWGADGLRQRGLLDVPGWQYLSFAAAAQAVQNSAYPARYAQWERPAHAWLGALGG